MFINPYKTTPCKNFVLDKLESATRIAYRQDRLYPVSDTNVTIIKIVSKDTGIPPFAHPLPVIVREGKDPDVFVDLREVTRDTGRGEYIVRRNNEYGFMVDRAKLQKLWLDEEDRYAIKVFSKLPAVVFTNWFSDIIAQRLGLSMVVKVEMSVIVGFYYHCLFDEEKKYSTDELRKMSVVISKNTKIPVARVLSIVEHLEYINDLPELLEVIKEKIDDKRLKQLTTAFVYATVGFSWVGSHVREIMAVALEHPPTWIAIMASCISDKSYKRTQVAATINRFEKHEDFDSFMRGYKRLI